MKVCCLDLEGVLVPEVWIHVARKFRMDSLKLTTRDIPDYDRLMRYRLAILKKEGIRLRDIQAVIRTMSPLPGARTFLDRLRAEFPVIILSDTYYEFAAPLIQKLGRPVLFCNWLKTDRKGFIADYILRERDGKKKAVQGLKKIGFKVYAAGDSYNDLSMLAAADRGILFRPPASIRKKLGRRFPVTRDHRSLLREFRS
ncbi:MAG: bifunctional phosphoserine phosphatase/homoserine phosphotransferase ThrH [Candidatus Omnitrophota bacterium]